MAKQSYHVVRNKSGGWDTKKSTAKRASRTFTTKAAAIGYARKVSSNQNVELYIHGADGRVLSKDGRNIHVHTARRATGEQIVRGLNIPNRTAKRGQTATRSLNAKH